MSDEFVLADALSLADLQVFLARAGRVDDGSVRLVAARGVLAAYVAVLHPSGLLDRSPTVLGLRTFALAEAAALDAVVPVAALAQRVARLQSESVDATAPVRVSVPPAVFTAAWAAISPPRGGWQRVATTTCDVLEVVARAGIDEVAAAIPAGTGEQIVGRVRAEVWGRLIAGLESVPAGGAFAALSLGFLKADDAVDVVATGPWTRLTTPRGHVLIKRAGGTLVG
ncbi:MAG: hypothetical protein H7146_08115 [Burkholderiaceae bacterium]|nr:hypothetical protein [Microbacteriaceae bacterium]